MRKVKRILSFTLMELVLAIALVSMIISLVSTALYALMNDMQTIQTQHALLRDFQTIDRLAESAFRNAIPFKWTVDKEAKEDEMLFVGNGNSIYFVYRHPITNDNPPSALRFLVITQEGADVVAYYRNTPIYPTEIFTDRENVLSEVIASNVRALEFSYALRDYATGNVTWVSSWLEDDPDIPIAIQMTIVWQDGTRHSWLRRTAGNGFDSSYDIREDEIEEEQAQVLKIEKTGSNLN